MDSYHYNKFHHPCLPGLFPGNWNPNGEAPLCYNDDWIRSRNIPEKSPFGELK